LAALGCDAKAQQKVIDFFLADSDLTICYANVSALFETVNGKQLWELPEEEQIKKANTFVQSAAQHFGKFVECFKNPLDRRRPYVPLKKRAGSTVVNRRMRQADCTTYLPLP
jgi:hypothetical protein